ncbi:MAG: hypothetical protein EPN85_11865, partial [Bacteroidetes bacterium]
MHNALYKFLRHEIFSYIILFGIVICLFGKTLLIPSDQLLSNGDLQKSLYYFHSFVGNSLRDHEFPFWNPHVFAGYPFLASPWINLFYPPNWLLYVLPLSRGYVWHFAFHLFLASSGMYILLRRFTHRVPALIGAIAFGLSGKLVTGLYAGYLDVTASSTYMPLTIGAIWLSLESRQKKYFFIAVIITALQILSGYLTMTIFTIQAAALLAIFLSVKQKGLRPLLSFLFIIILAVGLTAFQLLPTQELISLSDRSQKLMDDFYLYGEASANILRMMWNPFALGSLIEYGRTYKIGYFEHAFYIGKIPLLLTLIGISSLGASVVQYIRHRKTTFPVLLAIFSILLIVFGFWVSLGSTAPVNLMTLLVRYVPWYHFIRVPPRHLLYCEVGLAILASLGAQFVYSKKHGKIICTALLLITVFDLLIFSRSFIVSNPIPDKRQDPELLSFIAGQHESLPGRIHPGFTLGTSDRLSLDLNAPMKYGLFSDNGYDPVMLHNYNQFIRASNGVPDIFGGLPFITLTSPSLRFLNIKYILLSLTDDPLEQKSDSQYTHIFTKPDREYSLYVSTNTLPRFYEVPNVIVTSSRNDAYQHIASRSIQYDDTVILVSDKASTLPKTTCTKLYTKEIVVKYFGRNSIALSTSVPCSGYLVSSEVMYPGWEAYIDGKKTDLLEGNLAFRTVFVPAGPHSIEMRYNPRIFILGGIISFITLSVLLF